MTSKTPIHPAVLDAVRASLAKADAELDAAERDVQTKSELASAAVKFRDDLAAKRESLANFVRDHSIDSSTASGIESPAETPALQQKALESPQGPSAGAEPASPKRVVQLASDWLSAGGKMQAKDIYARLQQHGLVIMNDQPLRRLGQMLSASGLFDSDRLAGWSLKKTGDDDSL